jgi:hypothetical protein
MTHARNGGLAAWRNMSRRPAGAGLTWCGDRAYRCSRRIVKRVAFSGETLEALSPLPRRALVC